MAAKKRTANKKTTGKTPAKKAPAKKTPAKKAPAKKTPAKKTPAKKTPAKKTPAKKTPAKKTPAKKTPATNKASSKATAPAAGRTAHRRPERPSPPAATPARSPSQMTSARAQAPAPRRAAALRRTSPPRVPPGPVEETALPAEWMGGRPRDERRRFQRVNKALKVRLFAGGAGSGYLEAKLASVDMSLSGIFLRSTFFLPEGTPVRIEIDGAWGQTAEASGTVARLQRDGDQTGFGIHFDALDPTTLRDLVGIFVGERIERFVQSFSKQKGSRVDQEVLWEGILAWELERLHHALERED